VLLYTRDRLAVHSVHRPHGDHAHVYAYLSIYLRAISVYMYVCTVHYFRRSVNRINAIAKHGWLTGLAGWLAGGLVGQRSNNVGRDQPSRVRSFEPTTAGLPGEKLVIWNRSCATAELWTWSCRGGRRGFELGTAGQIRRPTLQAARNVLHYKVQDRPLSFSVFLALATSFFVSSFSLSLAFRVRSDA